MNFMEAVSIAQKNGYKVVKKTAKNVDESFMSFIAIERKNCEKTIRSILRRYIDDDAEIDELIKKYEQKLDNCMYAPVEGTGIDAYEALQKSYADLAYKILEEEGIKTDNILTPEDKLKEAKRVVTANGLRFVKESKKYAGRHPVFDSKKFQDYLLKECGTGCDDCECDGVDSRECCDDQEVNICPDCGGEGCEHCNFKGYIEWEGDPNNMSDNDVYNDIDDYDIENDDSSFSYGPENADEFIDDMAMQNFNSFQKGRRPLY